MKNKSKKINLKTVQNIFSKESINYEYYNELALNDLWINFETKDKQIDISKSVKKTYI